LLRPNQTPTAKKRNSTQHTNTPQPSLKMADTSKVVLSVYLSFLPILLCCIGLSHAQQVEIEPRFPVVRLGDPLELRCKAPIEAGSRLPLLYCRFEIPGEEPIRVSPNLRKPGFSWLGEQGLEQGECGITIQRVDNRNNGKVNCTLGPVDKPNELIGSVELIVGVAPRQPQWLNEQIDSNRNRLVKDDSFDRVCGVDGGRPPPNITFYLDNDEITDPRMVHDMEYFDNGSDNNTAVVRRLEYKLRAEDDGKTITCRAMHFAYPDGHADEPYQLKVNYPPQPQPEQTVYGVQVDKTAFAVITIQSNPRPHVVWYIEGTQVEEGAYQDRYEARSPVALEKSGYYNVTLVIDRLSGEDLNKVYRMKAINDYGQTEYTVRLSSTGAPLESSPLDVGTIVGIVMAGVLLIVLIGLLVVARATGRWCFAARPDNPRNKTERIPVTVDEEAGQGKVTAGQQLLTFKQRLLSMVAAARQAAAGKHEDGKATTAIDNDDENEKISTETAIIEDVPKQAQAGKQQEGKKDPNQLIYAELDIKGPAEAKVTVKKVDRPAPDKTEYAEILYVSPSSDSAGKEDKSKDIEMK